MNTSLINETNTKLNDIIEELKNTKNNYEAKLEQNKTLIDSELAKVDEYKNQFYEAKKKIQKMSDDINGFEEDYRNLVEKFQDDELSNILTGVSKEINAKIKEKKRNIQKDQEEMNSLIDKAQEAKKSLVKLTAEKKALELVLRQVTDVYKYYDEAFEKISMYTSEHFDNLHPDDEVFEVENVEEDINIDDIEIDEKEEIVTEEDINTDTVSEDTDEEEVFSAYEGGYFGESYFYTITKKNDKYNFVYKTRNNGKEFVNETDNIEDKEYYDKFINELTCVVDEWDENYIDDTVMDGTEWHIRMYDNNFKSSGSNEYPNNYDDAIDVIQRYFKVNDNVQEEDNVENNEVFDEEVKEEYTEDEVNEEENQEVVTEEETSDEDESKIEFDLDDIVVNDDLDDDNEEESIKSFLEKDENDLF